MYQMGIKVVFDFELGSFATNPATRSTTVPFNVTFIGPLPGFTFSRSGARLAGAVMLHVCPFHVLCTPICDSSWLTYQIGIYVVPPDTNESGCENDFPCHTMLAVFMVYVVVFVVPVDVVFVVAVDVVVGFVVEVVAVFVLA